MTPKLLALRVHSTSNAWTVGGGISLHFRSARRSADAAGPNTPLINPATGGAVRGSESVAQHGG